MLLAAGMAGALAVPAMAVGPVPAAEQSLASRHLGAARSYKVELPASYATSGDQRYPLLVVLDAQTQFAHVAATVRFLSDQGDIPEYIVVGVASGKRVHDYTQTDWPQMWVGGGGAAKFRRFIVDELLPTLDKTLRTSGDRMLMGHSASGQFALHMLATENAPFQGYLVASPSLDWDGRLPVHELEAALKARDRLPAFLYVAEEPSYGGALNDQLALRQVLQEYAPKGLHWQAVNYPKETHGSISLQATIDALRARHHGYRMHPDEAPILAEMNTSQNIDALGQRYALLARDGRAPQVPESAFVEVAQAHFRRNESQAGIALLRRSVAAYPGSADSREALADALKRFP